jgi:hypothetical protein
MAKTRPPVRKPSSVSPVHWLAVGLVVVAAAGAAIIFWRERQPSVTNVNRTVAIPAVAATPLNFAAFTGSVETIGQSELTVALQVTAPDGQRHTRTYQVAVDAATTFQLVTITDSGTAVSPIALTDLQKDDMVQVFDGDQNLNDVSSFTAARIVKLVST